MKAGLFFEYTTRPAARSSQFNGTFNFNRDTNNPLDTNHPFANALIGSVTQLLGGDRPSDCERAVRQRRVVRPGQLARGEEPDDRRGRPLLLDRADQEPGRRPGRLHPGPVQRGGGAGADPAGEHAAGPARPQPDHRRDRPGGEDRHVRAGSGDPTNGIEVFHESVMDTPAIQVAPRVGFCVGRQRRRQDGGARRLRRVPRPLQRRHRPAARRAAAAGQHADRQLHDHRRAARDAAEPEPGPGPHPQSATTSRSTPTTTASACSATSGGSWSATSPTSARRAGSCCRRATSTRCRTARNFLPSSIDPTTGGALPNAFLRPYLGYADILFSEFAGFSNYDALQMQVSRRYTAGLRFGVAYTFAKTRNVGIASPPNNNPTVNPFLVRRGSQLRRRRTAAQPRRRLLVPGAEPERASGTRSSPRSSSTIGKSRG